MNFEVFNDVASIETPDDLTVVIKMTRVNAPFLARLAENGAGAIIPVRARETSRARRRSERARSSSCDASSDTRSNSSRFDDYWDGPAYLDKIIATGNHRADRAAHRAAHR